MGDRLAAYLDEMADSGHEASVRNRFQGLATHNNILASEAQEWLQLLATRVTRCLLLVKLARRVPVGQLQQVRAVPAAARRCWCGRGHVLRAGWLQGLVARGLKSLRALASPGAVERIDNVRSPLPAGLQPPSPTDVIPALQVLIAARYHEANAVYVKYQVHTLRTTRLSAPARCRGGFSAPRLQEDSQGKLDPCNVSHFACTSQQAETLELAILLPVAIPGAGCAPALGTCWWSAPVHLCWLHPRC